MLQKRFYGNYVIVYDYFELESETSVVKDKNNFLFFFLLFNTDVISFGSMFFFIIYSNLVENFAGSIFGALLIRFSRLLLIYILSVMFFLFFFP